jgi:hypothetical protein
MSNRSTKPETTVEETAEADETSAVAEVMAQRSGFDENDLRALASFDDAVRLVEQRYGAIQDATTEIGDGFTVLSTEDKARLCGVPLLLMEWAFYPGKFGDRDFTAVRLIARMPGGLMGRYILNDGSTGLMEQLRKYTERTGRVGGLRVERGLTESTYTKELDDGQVIEATTYYLDTSAQ